MKTAKNTSLKSPSATASPAKPEPADFILSGDLAARSSALAEKCGVSADHLVRVAVVRYLDQVEASQESRAVDLALSPEHVAALKKYKIDGEALVRKQTAEVLQGIRGVAALMVSEPPAPNVERLEKMLCNDLDWSLKQPGIRLATPGLLGEVEIPARVAMNAMASAMYDFSRELMKLVVENQPEMSKTMADALMVAEVIFLKGDGSGAEAWRGGEKATEIQLFAQWAMGGTNFAEFEKILAEREERQRVRDAREEARRKSAAELSNGVAA